MPMSRLGFFSFEERRNYMAPPQVPYELALWYLGLQETKHLSASDVDKAFQCMRDNYFLKFESKRPFTFLKKCKDVVLEHIQE